MKKWEYTVIPRQKGYSDIDTQEFLNRKGQEGWELASIVIDASLVHHVFKREIPEAQPTSKTAEGLDSPPGKE